MNTQKRKPRQYRRITPETVAKFKIARVLEGNNTSAIRAIEPKTISAKDRAYRLAKKSEQESTGEFIENQLQQIGQDAINRIGIMVNSKDERIATKNSHFVVEQLRGKAVQKSINANLNIGIEDVLQ